MCLYSHTHSYNTYTTPTQTPTLTPTPTLHPHHIPILSTPTKMFKPTPTLMPTNMPNHTHTRTCTHSLIACISQKERTNERGAACQPSYHAENRARGAARPFRTHTTRTQKLHTYSRNTHTLTYYKKIGQEALGKARCKAVSCRFILTYSRHTQTIT